MNWRTRLIHSNVTIPTDFKSLASPVTRGSTVLFNTIEDACDNWRHRERGYSYGLFGNPTVLELGARVAELEGAHFSFVVPGGQSAIALVFLSFCDAGSHALMPISVYGPARELAEGLLKGLGMDVEFYEPTVGGDISKLIRTNTSLIWVESPGSVTMEIQDVPAIAFAARAHGVTIALDNTYSAGVLFDAFAHGVDVSVQALTKYIGGHSDVILGSVSVASRPLYERVGSVWSQLGMNVSPDDASLALRGLQTLGIRLDRLERSTLQVAEWLAKRPEIEKVLHPAMPSCVGHQLWKRDFSGSSSVLSVVFGADFTLKDVVCFVNALSLFKIGYSWGGTTSLVMMYVKSDRLEIGTRNRLVRMNIGLEEVDDLIEDLAQALNEVAAGKKNDDA